MYRSRIQGSIVGLAVGDALGHPAEFRTRRQLQQELGPEGITGFLRLKDPRFSRPFITGPDHSPGTFTDDTQMSLCVAEALLAAGRSDRDTLMREMARRFVQWHRSEDNNRSPGETTGIACQRLASEVPWREEDGAPPLRCRHVRQHLTSAVTRSAAANGLPEDCQGRRAMGVGLALIKEISALWRER